VVATSGGPPAAAWWPILVQLVQQTDAARDMSD